MDAIKKRRPRSGGKHIALRITAIRETFEELGLLLCSRERKDQRSDAIDIGVVTDIDVKLWQERLTKNPGELYNLCKEHNCYPDIWSLHYWSSWLSPVRLPKRFITAFFVTALASRPALEYSSEVSEVEWSSPLETLKKPDVVLYPPQVYEFHRLAHLADFDELIKYTKERSCHGTDVLYPVFVNTRDGRVSLLPGDSLYPSIVDYYDTSVTSIDKTVLEIREGCEVLHRFELQKGKQPELVLHNYRPQHHINMGDRIIEANLTLH